MPIFALPFSKVKSCCSNDLTISQDTQRTNQACIFLELKFWHVCRRDLVKHKQLHLKWFYIKLAPPKNPNLGNKKTRRKRETETQKKNEKLFDGNDPREVLTPSKITIRELLHFNKIQKETEENRS